MGCEEAQPLGDNSSDLELQPCPIIKRSTYKTQFFIDAVLLSLFGNTRVANHYIHDAKKGERVGLNKKAL